MPNEREKEIFAESWIWNIKTVHEEEVVQLVIIQVIEDD